MQQITEEMWLWEELRYGNETALYQLYMDNYDNLFRFGLRISVDKALSMDCINEVFADIWRRRQELPKVDNVGGYLFVIFKRCLLSKLKKEKKRHFYERESLIGSEKFEYSYEYMLVAMQEKKEMKIRIKRAIEKLTPRQRELIRLRYFENKSMEEIADKIRISLRTVYNTIHLAIKSLREELKNG